MNPSHAPEPSEIAFNPTYETYNPAKINRLTCMISVKATAFKPPYSEYASESNPSKIIESMRSNPVRLFTALAPSHKIVGRMTNTYIINIRTANNLLTRVSYLCDNSCGIVKTCCFK